MSKSHQRLPLGNTRQAQVLCLLLAFSILAASNIWFLLSGFKLKTTKLPINASEIIATCNSISSRPGPPPSFSTRMASDRFEPGTYPVWLQNATIWTGSWNGSQIITGDVYLERGLIRAVGRINSSIVSKNATIIDLQGAWITPGIVDVHSHLAVGPSPELAGAQDSNSRKGPIVPWLRSVDGLNTHDELFRLAVAGGVTTSLILPGSANAIAGEGFVIKLRPTVERSSSSLLLEPPHNINGSKPDPSRSLRWRHMKHACGENPATFYGNTRMDTVWLTRRAYSEALRIKRIQDAFCSRVRAGQWDAIGEFPESLEWEPLVAVLRGQVKVQTHCYEAVDFDRFISISNEFEFPVAAFHHAHEAFLVPDLLKKAHGSPPAVAMFATFARYKKEAYRHSEYAPRILADAGIKVVMKSDSPAIVPRYLLHEAQQANYYGLPSNLALSSVTTAAAEVLGLDHRIGFIRTGYDADIVVWDSHPLSLGATPMQVYIDGVDQLPRNVQGPKHSALQKAPITPNFDKEAKAAVEHVGLPPLGIQKSLSGKVVFYNVSGVWDRDGWAIRELSQGPVAVVVDQGRVVCVGSCVTGSGNELEIDLHGGWITPALVSFGSSIGLQHIASEPSTVDGSVTDVLSSPFLSGMIVKAADGVQLGTRDALLAYRAGVSSAITAPSSTGFLSGISVHFSLGASNRLDNGAILQNTVAIHVAIAFGQFHSVGTQIGVLRRLLLHPSADDIGHWFRKAAEGAIPLLISANGADVIATILELKAEVELFHGKALRLSVVGGAEAHLLADQLAASGVGIILYPPRPAPYTWDRSRLLPGPPLSSSPVKFLLSKNVTVAIAPQGVMASPEFSAWAVRNLRFDAGWTVLDSNGHLSMRDALAIASLNVEKLLGVEADKSNTDLAVTWGGDLFSFESKVVAMISPRRKRVDILE